MASKTQPSHPPHNPVTKIKKEPPDCEIKGGVGRSRGVEEWLRGGAVKSGCGVQEYAESAMKEMLGWYGLGGGGTPESEGGGGGGGGTSSDPEATSSSAGRRSPSPPHNIPAGCMCCAWCQKVGNAKQFNFKTPSGNKVFCSEVCFTQCRRANFKRNKTCDWCRHVRHTVNYVDFQDGDHQLQFCSDKCLNQYKMNIFCKETQAHLELHPHLQEAGGSQGSGLITPELWMRDCRSQSPDSDRSATPPRIPSPLIEIKMSPPPSSPPSDLKQTTTPFQTQKRAVHKDLGKRKSLRNKKNGKSSLPTLPVERTSSSSPRSGGSVSPPKPNHFPSPLPHLLPPPHFLSPDPHRPPMFFPPGFLPPPHMFPDPRFGPQRPPPPRKFPQGSPNGGGPPPPLLPITRPLHPPPLLPLLPQHSLLPPPTTLVPYPLFIPIPVPIPIPIPMPNLLNSFATMNGANSSPPRSPDEETSPKQQDTPTNLSTKVLKSSTPHRKRKRLTEISQEDETLRKPKSVHA